MAASLQSQNKRNFWREVKHVTVSRNYFVNMMDGDTGKETISSLFASKYKDLYNSVSYDVDSMQIINDSISSKISK